MRVYYVKIMHDHNSVHYAGTQSSILHTIDTSQGFGYPGSKSCIIHLISRYLLSCLFYYLVSFTCLVLIVAFLLLLVCYILTSIMNFKMFIVNCLTAYDVTFFLFIGYTVTLVTQLVIQITLGASYLFHHFQKFSHTFSDFPAFKNSENDFLMMRHIICLCIMQHQNTHKITLIQSNDKLWEIECSCNSTATYLDVNIYLHSIKPKKMQMLTVQQNKSR